MAFDPKEALRAAGVLNDPIAAEVEAAFATLTKEETDLLISLKDKLPAALPVVMAGGQWARPEVEVHNESPEASCLCGAWSGSGSGSTPTKPNP
ncbi:MULTISPECIES: StsA-related sactipeptide RiPP [unclassified Nonomuraea]|uniref:StsA-related sactipeptide RiPP n=1 Tax=unclassified Nonomuraea TaxID=2593643 RepID=UPI0033C11FA3